MPCSDSRDSEWYREEEARVALVVAIKNLFSVGDALPGDPRTVQDVAICAYLRNQHDTDKEAFEVTIYNGRNSDARKVADWWDLHRLNDENNHKRLVRLLVEATSKMEPGIPITVVDVPKSRHESGWLNDSTYVFRGYEDDTPYRVKDLTRLMQDAFPTRPWDLAVIKSHQGKTIVYDYVTSTNVTSTANVVDCSDHMLVINPTVQLLVGACRSLLRR